MSKGEQRLHQQSPQLSFEKTKAYSIQKWFFWLITKYEWNDLLYHRLSTEVFSEALWRWLRKQCAGVSGENEMWSIINTRECFTFFNRDGSLKALTNVEFTACHREAKSSKHVLSKLMPEVHSYMHKWLPHV